MVGLLTIKQRQMIHVVLKPLGYNKEWGNIHVVSMGAMLCMLYIYYYYYVINKNSCYVYPMTHSA